MQVTSFFKQNRLTPLFMLVLFVMVMLPETSWARSAAEMGVLFSTALDKVIDLFNNSKMVLLIIGGFGLIAVAFLAVFGKVKWGWLAGLAFGLAAVAAAGAIVRYSSGDPNAGLGMIAPMADTYQNIGGGYAPVVDISVSH